MTNRCKENAASISPRNYFSYISINKIIKMANISCHQQYEHDRKRLTYALSSRQLMCLWEPVAMRKHEHNYKSTMKMII